MFGPNGANADCHANMLECTFKICRNILQTVVSLASKMLGLNISYLYIFKC